MAMMDAVALSEDDVVNGCVLGPHGYVYRPPPPSKQLTIEMQVSVTECRSWREVLSVVENLGDLFDFRNTSTAVHRVAKFSVEAGESKIAQNDSRFPRLLQLLRAKCKDLSAWGLSDASWGMAKMQCRDDEIFQRISLRAQEIVQEMGDRRTLFFPATSMRRSTGPGRQDLDPQGLAIVAWSFATVGRKDEVLLQRIAEEARSKLDSFGVQNISNLVWANATLGLRADALHADLLRHSLARLDDFTTQELAIVNWAFTKLAYPVGDDWKAALRQRVLRLKEYAPSELSMIAWALAMRGDYDPDLLAYIARRSMELMRSFTGQNLATIIWAIATISYKDKLFSR
eukprot:g6135.t1